MSEDSASDQIEGLYQFIWPSAQDGEDRLGRLDEDLGGKPLDQVLFTDLLAQGLHGGMTVLDVGCGVGTYVHKFRQIFGCTVIGVDPVESNLEQAQAHADDKVQLLKGQLEALPVADASIDWIWCYDTFNHVWDLPAAFRESARVLKPGGRMLLCSAVAPGNVTHLEATCRTLGIYPLTLKRPAVEDAWHHAGFRAVLSQSTSDADSRYFECFDGHEQRDYLRLARLMRARNRFELVLGARTCDYLQAYYHWNVMLMIRQLEYVVWILQKP